jgi:hypothetical protein
MANLEITKQVPLSKQLLNVAERRIEELGVKFPEYVRHLILMDTQNIQYLSDKQEKALLSSLRDVKEGRTKALKGKEEIKEYFETLADESDE